MGNHEGFKRSKPQVNEATVKAVGGCQEKALRALVEEMGYEIVAPKQVVVRPGESIRTSPADETSRRYVMSGVAYKRATGVDLRPGMMPVGYVNSTSTPNQLTPGDYFNINGQRITKFEDD